MVSTVTSISYNTKANWPKAAIWTEHHCKSFSIDNGTFDHQLIILRYCIDAYTNACSDYVVMLRKLFFHNMRDSHHTLKLTTSQKCIHSFGIKQNLLFISAKMSSMSIIVHYLGIRFHTHVHFSISITVFNSPSEKRNSGKNVCFDYSYASEVESRFQHILSSRLRRDMPASWSVAFCYEFNCCILVLADINSCVWASYLSIFWRSRRSDFNGLQHSKILIKLPFFPRIRFDLELCVYSMGSMGSTHILSSALFLEKATKIVIDSYTGNRYLLERLLNHEIFQFSLVR